MRTGCAAGDEHVLEAPRLREGGAGLREEGRRHDRDLRAAVVEEVEVVLGAQQRVGRDGHRADLDRAPERAEELRRVETQHEHAVFHLHAQLEQRVARAVDEVVHIAIRERAAFAVERRRVLPPCGDVAIDEPRRHVELLRQLLGCDHFALLHVHAAPIVEVTRWPSLASGLLSEVTQQRPKEVA